MTERFRVTLTEREARTLGLPAGSYPAQLDDGDGGQGQLSPDSERVTLTFRVWAPGLSGDPDYIGTVARTYLAI